MVNKKGSTHLECRQASNNRLRLRSATGTSVVERSRNDIFRNALIYFFHTIPRMHQPLFN